MRGTANPYTRPGALTPGARRGGGRAPGRHGGGSLQSMGATIYPARRPFGVDETAVMCLSSAVGGGVEQPAGLGERGRIGQRGPPAGEQADRGGAAVEREAVAAVGAPVEPVSDRAAHERDELAGLTRRVPAPAGDRGHLVATRQRAMVEIGATSRPRLEGAS